MKKFYLLILMLISVLGLEASHIFGGEIQLSHVQNFEYEIRMNVFIDDLGGLPPPSNLNINVYERESATLISTFNLPAVDNFLIPPALPGCNSNTFYPIRNHVYSDTVLLDSGIFNHPGGYLFEWTSCCRANLENVTNSSSAGMTAVTLFPPVVDNSFNQIINNTPSLNTPLNDMAYKRLPYSLDFGGFDPDGDSLVFELYTPFDDGGILPGTPSAVTAPYKDPATQFNNIQWAIGYNADNQVFGFPGPNPSPNRMKVDPATGQISVVPEVSGPGYFAYGIVCREYRNGVLIGSVYRDLLLQVSDQTPGILNTTPPLVSSPSLQAFATWNADTIVFSGAPVCIQFDITDADSVALINLSVDQNDYAASDMSFLQSSARIGLGDTFNTALCFQPDSFISGISYGEIIAEDLGCYQYRYDTLPFWFKFTGYSNAGWGGNKTLPMTSISGSIDLFSLLDFNPLAGGTWYDLDGNNHMSPNGFLEWKYVTQPKTYRFIYVQQEPNYPPDTAQLTLNFVRPVELENELENEVLIYPNPAKGFVLIECQSQMLGARFSVRNILGQIEKNGILNNRKNMISLEKLNPGYYFVYIEKGTDNQTYTIIIQ
jgi:hypothetical protein